AVFNAAAAIPFALWAGACLAYGAWLAVGERNPHGPLASVSAMVMHFAWSAGFWREVIVARNRVRIRAAGREMPR
ncbi:MAG: hypothetical protein IE919_19655, partial [Thioclava sp.]|nr:hypothetical protein [Thioclava sp.]